MIIADGFVHLKLGTISVKYIKVLVKSSYNSVGFYVCCLFKRDFNSSDHIVLNSMMISEFESTLCVINFSWHC